MWLSTHYARHAALFSSCRDYRFTLRRDLARSPFDQSEPRPILFIMLNPSTADETEPDATITRCIGYAAGWGFSQLFVCNLFAFRATEPRDMKAHSYPVSPLGDNVNDDAISNMAQAVHDGGGLIVCGWGNHGAFMNRGNEIRSMLREYPLHCLSQNKNGEPGHPLYLKKTLPLRGLT